jgi:putative tryptophan/tyrosine transport system substrate-binding protein
VSDLRRREFITLLGGAAAAWPLSARAQQPIRRYRIGILETISQVLNAANLAAFRKSLRDLGYIEGKNLSIDYRSADGRAERFSEMATELLHSNVDLIVTRGTPASLAAKNAAPTIPVVMAAVAEPLDSGLVAGLARPGGNVTGLSSFAAVLDAKRVEFLREAVPGVARIAAFMNMGNPVQLGEWKEIETAAQSMGIRPQLIDVRKVEDIGSAFDAASREHADALVVGIDAIMQANSKQITDQAAKRRLPAIYASREFIETGGLLAYGVSYPDLYRRAAIYVDKILKGAKPADLPVEQPTKFELIINLQTAKALGLEIPPTLLARADEVIE